MVDETAIKQNLQEVLEKIKRAKERVGRKDEIILVAVTKTFPPEVVKASYRAGVRHFGENYVQEALEKIEAVPDATWHFIGRLQKNKAKFIPHRFDWVHSIDSEALADVLEKKAREKGAKINVLIQVNIAGEETKAGVSPEKVEPLVEKLLEKKHLQLQGLMIIPPIPETPEDSRRWFASLRELRDKLVQRGFPRDALNHLSMGMSDDFEVAVEEGATIVRIGRKIFGERRKR